MTKDFRATVREAVRDEALLRASLADSDIAPMLMALVQLTGDLELMDEVAPHIQGPWNFPNGSRRPETDGARSAGGHAQGLRRPRPPGARASD